MVSPPVIINRPRNPLHSGDSSPKRAELQHPAEDQTQSAGKPLFPLAWLAMKATPSLTADRVERGRMRP